MGSSHNRNNLIEINQRRAVSFEDHFFNVAEEQESARLGSSDSNQRD